MIEIMFTLTNSGVKRAVGYATVAYSSDNENETVVKTTEDGLSSTFEQAKSHGETLDGADATLADAIANPLAYLDFLILVDGTIEFDVDYVRTDQTLA